MSYVFVILDELIEDLKSGESGKRLHVINRLIGLRNSKYRTWSYSNTLTEYGIVVVLEINRILNRLDDGDILNAIEMMREFQESYVERDGEYYVYEYNSRCAWRRYDDWRREILKREPEF